MSTVRDIKRGFKDTKVTEGTLQIWVIIIYEFFIRLYFRIENEKI